MTGSALELTQDLIRINTVNPPGNERAWIEPLELLLADAGFTNTIHDFGPGRANLVARMGGSGEKPPLCFTGHVGIVTLTVAGQTFGRRMPLSCRSGRIPPLLHRFSAELTK